MDWYESQWWLNATKNGSSKWKNASGRNRTKVYIYPSFGHFDDIELPKTTVRTTTSTVNNTIPTEETLIILPGTNMGLSEYIDHHNTSIDLHKIHTSPFQSNNMCYKLTRQYCPVLFVGPEDITDFKDGLYQWSVTLTARMWPPIESGSPKQFLGLPVIVWWGILSGCLIVFLILFLLTFIFCWLLPRRRQKKLDLSQNSVVTRDSTGLSSANSTGVICELDNFDYFTVLIVREKKAWKNLNKCALEFITVPHSTIGVKPWANLLTNTSSVCNSVSASQYNSPPVHSLTSSSMYRHQYMLNYQQFPSSSSCGVNSNASSFDDCSLQNTPDTHKSMWVLNPLYASTGGEFIVLMQFFLNSSTILSNSES